MMDSIKSIITNKFPVVLKAYFISRLVFEQKRLWPNRTKLIFSGHNLYADPLEPRGLSLLRNRGAGQPLIKKYWRTAIRIYQPEILVDVGANYGEVFLDTTYPEHVQSVIAIEANQELCTYLNKSVKDHPDQEKIGVFNNLAAERSSDNVTFYIDKTSSGRSTALAENFVKDSKTVNVSSIRLDQLISSVSEDFKTVVFKIDVEGFEPYVISGMSTLMDSDCKLIGCIEFNLSSLQRNQIDVAEYLQQINSSFKVLLLPKNQSLISVDQLSPAFLQEYFVNDSTEGDLLLFSSLELRNRFLENWEV